MYVDSSVIMGMSGDHNGTGFDGIEYMLCSADNDFFPDFSKVCGKKVAGMGSLWWPYLEWIWPNLLSRGVASVAWWFNGGLWVCAEMACTHIWLAAVKPSGLVHWVQLLQRLIRGYVRDSRA